MSEIHSQVLFIELERLQKEKADLNILAYPSKNSEEIKERISLMREHGINSLAVKCTRNGYEPLLLGKGVRGVVVLGLREGTKTAVKLVRSDSPVKNMGREAEMHLKANSLGLGPKLFSWSEKMIIMEYIEGVKFGDLITKSLGKNLKKIVELILEQCYTLDVNHFDHGQLTNSSDHVIVTKDGIPYIIDFSHSSTFRRPANVTSIISYLFNTCIKQTDELLHLLRYYKNGFRRSVFDMLKQNVLKRL